jgi:hypothetical protein
MPSEWWTLCRLSSALLGDNRDMWVGRGRPTRLNGAEKLVGGAGDALCDFGCGGLLGVRSDLLLDLVCNRFASRWKGVSKSFHIQGKIVRITLRQP